MLEIEDLSVAYGAVEALKGVSLKAAPGRITAIVGANGAGKSSLLKAVAGIAPIAAGRIRLAGADLTGVPAHRRAARGLGFAMEGRRLFRDMQVQENLQIAWGFGPRRTQMERAMREVYDNFPVLAERRTVKAGMLSGGQQQMLILSSVTIREPEYMLLDEPSLGLAPIIVQQIFDYVVEHCRERETTVLLAEQKASMALEIADYGYVLRNGRAVMEGDSAELADADLVQQLSTAYL